MKFRSLFVILACSAAMLAPAQSSNSDRAAHATKILVKVRQVDLLNQILPLLMTKKQLEDILPYIERIRADHRKTEIMEYDMLVKFEPMLDQAIKDGIEKDLLPSNDVFKEGIPMFTMFTIRRNAISQENLDGMMTLLEKTLNAGQKKAMTFAMKPTIVQSGIDPAKMTDIQKQRYFVDYILLDPAAYELLVKLSQRKPRS